MNKATPLQMKKRFYLFTLFIACYQIGQAQVELVPITENAVILRHLGEQKLPGKQSTAIEKNACGNLEQPGVTYVQTNRTVAIKIGIDTAGLGSGTFGCQNCQFTEFGYAEVINNTLYYTGRGDKEAGQDEVRVEFCTNPSNCITRTYSIVARRPGKVHSPTFITTIPAATTDTLAIGVSNLPGRRAVCGSILDCKDAYDGGGQQEIIFFKNDPTQGRFVYQASRFPGLDTVCIAMCDSFAVCDTFQFAIQVTTDTLDIPFMDDFSYFGPYPDDTHWLDQEVFINNDMADTPPSWGVATFDGLNSKGTAYGGGYGNADKLTSTYINLGNTTENVYLTYWLQRRGFGDRPEVQDSIILEFKDRAGKWQAINKLPGAPVNESASAASPFRFYSFLVPNEYKYNTFQFRFRNLSDRTGILDVWHLDYVRLDQNFPDSIFRDIAFTKLPNFILKKYSGMPWKQFRGNEEKELNEFITANIWNHGPEALSRGNSSARLWETVSNIDMFRDSLFNGTQGNIEQGKPLQRKYSLKNASNDPNSFPNVWDKYLENIKKDTLDKAYERNKKLAFRLEYNVAGFREESDIIYDGAITRNNGVRRFTTFENYYSYDDGTAEAGIIAQPRVEVALQYELNKPDTLRAIQFHFPRTTVDIANQRFTIKVWVDSLNTTPKYQAFSQRAYYADIFFDTLQGFTTYPLVDASGKLTPLALPTGKFYVGWEQETSCEGTRCIPVGFDRNSQAIPFTFQKTSNRWEAFPASFFPGAVMIRPVVGSETPRATSTDDLQKPIRNFALYPNPTRDILNITPSQGWYEDFQYLLFNSAGQQLSGGALQPQVSVSDLPPGIYFIKIADRKTNQIWNERFIIAK